MMHLFLHHASIFFFFTFRLHLLREPLFASSLFSGFSSFFF